ncbi:MAG: hypothetical protein WDM81_01935 [Rhizomicrobium sp.]
MRSRFFLALFPLLLATPAWARSTLDSILPQIRAQHPGRLSDAEPWTDGEGNPHYRIKWMTPDGRVIYFDANARTGRYSNSGGDDGNSWRRSRGDGEDGGRRGRWNTDQDDGESRGGGRGKLAGRRRRLARARQFPAAATGGAMAATAEIGIAAAAIGAAATGAAATMEAIMGAGITTADRNETSAC